ncbi:MAG: glycosyl hydrolase family 8 [Leptolyngbyaceae cyanobacterium bins.349]|nr:glycosyl hydrolase family 8 [Leptolyngbyaceae cyanobacterium bins.349]
MNLFYWRMPLLLTVMLPLVGLESCRAMTESTNSPAVSQPAPIMPVAAPVAAIAPLPKPTRTIAVAPRLTTIPASDQTLLLQSWAAYRQRFIQTDGRVIDWEASERSTSEGQAYAMLRAVMVGDRATFDRTLQWAENNLQRQQQGQKTDSLWAWHWGQTPQGQWGILDSNFASDADIDAITALILASRRWQHRPYLDLAQTKLQDLWHLSTVTDARPGAEQRRYLLPGPAAAFQKQAIAQLNPSYFAPASFRLFAQVDKSRNWLSLVESSYQVLQQAASLSTTGLPNDWILLDLTTSIPQPLLTPNPGTSEYGFDAYRVWWRLALDADWFGEPLAKSLLQTHLQPIQQLWRSRQLVPARIDLQGNPLVAYEATAQYGMLYHALRLVNPALARQIRQQELDPVYRNGFWDNNSAYYTQNLVWFGLAPSAPLAPLLKP